MDVGTVNTIVGIMASAVATATGVIALKEHFKREREKSGPQRNGENLKPVPIVKPTNKPKTSGSGTASRSTEVSVFENDESSYFKWLSDNPDGYVVNTEKRINPAYMALHRADCRHVSKYSAQASEGAFTERGYIKACSTDKASLNKWAKQHGKQDGPLTSSCPCKPND